MTDAAVAQEALDSVRPLDRAFLAALREPRRNRLSVFSAALEAHRGHRTFRSQGWPFSRELGFTCQCNGTEREWRIDIGTLRGMVPAAREAFLRMHRHHGEKGNRERKRRARRAQHRAKALLHQFLSRQQRWDLRATKAFEVVGQDGVTYRITEGTCNNVQRIEDGEPRWSLCLVTTGYRVPIYDLMLAQKLLLEADIATFLQTAEAQDLKTKETYRSAEFLLTGDDPPPKEEPGRPVPILRDLPDEVLDNPGPWVQQQLDEGELP